MHKSFSQKAIAAVSIVLMLPLSSVVLPMTTYAVANSPTISIDSISDPISGDHTPPFNFNNCTTNPLFNPVTVSGSGSGSAPPGNADQYAVQIDWGDASVTNGLGTFTPPSGHVDFTFTFSDTHSYTTTGDYIITAKLYHQAPPGNDNQGDASVAVSTCIHVPPPTTGSLTVTKEIINDDGGTATVSDFTLKVGDTTVINGVVNDFVADTYAITETGPTSGYTATFSDDCDEYGNITIVAGSVYSCTITNDDNETPPPIPATLTLQKTVVNDNGGDATTTDFAVFINSATSSWGTHELSAGSYTVSEATIAGYTPSAWDTDCAPDGTITLEEGDDKVCTITNDDIAPTLTLIKYVTNDNGGDAVVSDFPLFINGNPATSSVPVTLDANTLYTATETTLNEYTPSVWGTDCAQDGTITLNEGDVKTCTITNDDIAPQLTVIKHVINDNEGTLSAGNFTLHVTGTDVSSSTFSGVEAPGTVVTMDAGAFSVYEDEVAGYASSTSGICSGTLALSETATCTITNDDVLIPPEPGTLTLTKTVTNDDDGNATTTDFAVYLDGVTTTWATPIELQPGSYTVSEETGEGYEASAWGGDCNPQGHIVIAEGGTYECTITNNDVPPPPPPEPGTLIVEKVIPDGVEALPQDFSFTVNGGDPVAFEADGENQITVEAGVYTIIEVPEEGFTPTYEECSEITIPEGGSATCTITNNVTPATLHVIKHVVNDNGSTSTASDFIMLVTGVNVSTSTFPGAEDPGTTVTLYAGQYSVSEDSVFGYNESASETCSGTILAGEETTCTITNNDVPQPDSDEGTLIVRKVILNNDEEASPQDFSFIVNGDDPVVFEADGENHLTVDVGTYTVTEVAREGYTTTYDGCSQVAIAEDEEATCTITNDQGAEPVNTPPVITRIGSSSMDVTRGHTFTDPGATATDAEDGDLTSSIVRTGSVDTSTVGTYTLTYTVTDSGGLSASVTRTVTVKRSGGGGNNDEPTDTGASTSGGVTSCSYLNDYLRIDFVNDPIEVTKLQIFLQQLEGEIGLQVTGIFDQATFDAVSRFQNKYELDILTPWGYTDPTGYVYILTKKKINEIVCQLAFPVTPLQQEEIDAFRAFLESLRNQGAGNLETNFGVGGAPGEEEGAGTSGNLGEVGLGETTTSGTTTPFGVGLLAFLGLSDWGEFFSSWWFWLILILLAIVITLIRRYLITREKKNK